MKTKRSRRALPVLLLALAIQSAAVDPHYLSFFNLFAGGASNGPNYLADSNADWGQDLNNLKVYADRNRSAKLRQPMAKIGYSIYLYDLRRGAGK